MLFFDLFSGRGPALAALVARNLLTVAAGLFAFRALTRMDRDDAWAEPAGSPASGEATAPDEPTDDPDPLVEMARTRSGAKDSSGSEDRPDPDPRWFR